MVKEGPWRSANIKKNQNKSLAFCLGSISWKLHSTIMSSPPRFDCFFWWRSWSPKNVSGTQLRHQKNSQKLGTRHNSWAQFSRNRPGLGWNFNFNIFFTACQPEGGSGGTWASFHPVLLVHLHSDLNLYHHYQDNYIHFGRMYTGVHCIFTLRLIEKLKYAHGSISWILRSTIYPFAQLLIGIFGLAKP